MEPKSLTKLGSSLPVPFVQELAKEISNNVTAVTTERYICPDQDPPFTTSHTPTLPDGQVPVIDMNNLLNSSQKLVMESELEKLHYASKEWGFFQLINHGVNSCTVEKVKSGIEEFFNLPMEEKKKFFQQPGDMEGFGHAFVVSEEQKLDWSDMFYMTTLPKSLRKSHLFPSLPLPFRETLEAYSSELESLAKRILDFMAKALGMEAKDMKELIGDGWQAMRMNYYPPFPQPELVIGLNPHSDGVGLTILLQTNEMEGLQIRKNGVWLPVKPLPNAFIVNIGDMLQVMTNGIYSSVEHRATVNATKERLSIATFYGPSLANELGPAPSLVTPERPALFRRIGVADFFRGYFARELRGKTYVDVLRICDEDEGHGNAIELS